MNGLYIEGYQVDVDDNEIFAFTYSNSNIAEPEAIKNNYSKSVNLKGTNNNNKIFGEIWKLDREVLDGGYAGAYFNPKKRAGFELYHNGEILEKGYIRLDNITMNQGEVTYSVTLFGSLGDFFYNLMYQENGEEKSLADLKLGLNKEDDKKLLDWTAEYIKNSWDLLKDEFDESNRDPENWITAAPTYSGLYDDFDCDKVLVAMDSLPNNVRAELLPDQFTEGGVTYKSKYGYGLCGLQRDFSEWEARDLRSLYQRPAIKTKLALDAISNPENNGGYEVVWDEEFKNTAYFTQSYIVCPRLEWEDGYTNASEIIPEYTPTADGWYTIKLKRTNGTNPEDYVFNLQGVNEPKMTITLQENIAGYDNSHKETLGSCYLLGKEAEYVKFWGYYDIIGGFLYKYIIKINGEVKQVLPKFVTLNSWTVNLHPTTKETLSNYIIKNYAQGATSVSYHSLPRAKYKETPGSVVSNWETDEFESTIVLPEADGVTVELQRQYIVMCVQGVKDLDYDPMTGIPVIPDEAYQIYTPSVNKKYKGKFNYREDRNDKYWFNTETDITLVLNSSNYFEGISSNIQKIAVTKDILFSNIGSPFKILTDFCKQFNLRFRIVNDVTNNKKGIVYIEQRKNYFSKDAAEVIQLDHGKDITITPTTAEYKYYKFGTEDEDTYAYYLYKGKYGEDYSSYTYDSNYNFNNEKKELFEDSIFKVGIDFRLTSPYFNTNKRNDTETDMRYPQICLTPKYEWTLWHNDESQDKTKFGLQSYNTLSKLKDQPKMCLFDKDDKYMDMTVLCFFNGFEDYDNILVNNKAPYLLTNNLPIMNELNGDNSCYIYGSYNNQETLQGYIDKENQGTIGYWITKLPKFSANYITYKEEIRFEQRYVTTDCKDKFYNVRGEITFDGRFIHNDNKVCLVLAGDKDSKYDLTFKFNTASASVSRYYLLGFCDFDNADEDRELSQFSDITYSDRYGKLQSDKKYLIIQLNNARLEKAEESKVVNTEVVVPKGQAMESFYFKQPKASYTDQDYSETRFIYDKYWSSYIRDLYNDNAKKVEGYCFLKDKPQDALRKFYQFDNAKWSLNDIEDYNYKSDEPVKCTFIKVDNTENYS